MTTSSAPEMIAIAIHEFVSTGVAPVDLYIQLQQSRKFILLAKEGTKDLSERLKSYENKAVKVLYVSAEDYARYTSLGLQFSASVLEQRDILPEKKADIVIKSSNAVMEEINISGFDNSTFEHSRVISQQILKLVDVDPQSGHCLESLEQLTNPRLANSIAVGIFSVMIGRALSWTSKGTMEKLILGGILHDIGLQKLNPALLSKPMSDMSATERSEYETYPQKGKELLQQFPEVHADVIAIVYEHRENALGHGFPRKLRDIRMSPLARVVGLAHQFVSLVLANPQNPGNKMSPVEAIHHIEKVLGQPFNKEVFMALKQVVKTLPRAAA
jgi:HD-GYP domain-containing protein (c-di-GMP phosphodiesterase class II)